MAKTREELAKEASEKRKTANVNEELKRSPHYSEEAMLKMVNLLYDPLTTQLCEEVGIAAQAQLLSLTRINSSREAFFWATQMAKEATFNTERKWPLSQIIRTAFLLARRSIDMKAFMLGVGLAQEQAITKTEETGEDADW